MKLWNNRTPKSTGFVWNKSWNGTLQPMMFEAAQDEGPGQSRRLKYR